MQQWNSRPRHKTAATTGRQEDTQAEPRAGGRKASGRVFHQASENERQGIVDESVPSQTEEEMAKSLYATRNEQPKGGSSMA
jgi:hypothetical protein